MHQVSRLMSATLESITICALAEYQNLLVETRGTVGLVTLNRPKALTAQCFD